MKVLVLGSNGQIGRCLKDQLLKTNYLVTYSSREELDITNFFDSNSKIEKINPNIIINAAAYTNVDKAEEDTVNANLINNLAVENIANLCSKNGIVLIHISTDYIFDGYSVSPYLETDQANPLSFYGKSKLQGENAIVKSKCKSIILRTSWVYSEYGNNFVKTIIKLCNDLDSISVISDQTGCPTYAQDIAKAILNLLPLINKKISPFGIYNYCGDTSLSWYEFAMLIEKKYITTEKHIEIIPISSDEYDSKASRPKFSLLNCFKYQDSFGLSPSNLQEGIEKTIKVLKLNNI